VTQDDGDLLFEGLKVLDVGSWIAGPVAGTILGDFGADVIKVELPGIGDAYRNLSALPVFPDADENYMWQMDARNKRSLSLNLKSEQGRAILHQLVRECDVYITNNPLPMRRALELNYEDLKPLNERMIYASLTSYGEDGPEKDREAFDLVAYWARTGLMDLVRTGGSSDCRCALCEYRHGAATPGAHGQRLDGAHLIACKRSLVCVLYRPGGICRWQLRQLPGQSSGPGVYPKSLRDQ
jgi:crotonobetainyl-CoA:carnitine CoA-transferase CaiB-like acyl-CoA transferase